MKLSPEDEELFEIVVAALSLLVVLLITLDIAGG